MNDHDDNSGLGVLSNDDVETLYAICKRAGELNEPPFRALFAALDEVKQAGGLSVEQYATLEDYVMRIGDSAKSSTRQGHSLDLLEQLRHILDAEGILVLDPLEGSEQDDTEAAHLENVPHKKILQHRARRVSFDDANFEETWLSEHSQSIGYQPPLAAPRSLLDVPPRRGRNAITERRARSTSAQRGLPIRRAAPKLSQHNLPTAHNVLHSGNEQNPTLYFEPSQTQLELNADVFQSTSALRSTRQALHRWHDRTVRLQGMHSQAYSNAAAHDRRTLLKQAFDQWRSASSLLVQENRNKRHLDKLCERARYFRDKYLVNKAFTHWAMSCEEEKLRLKVAQRHMLRVTYFRRWRAIACANQAKVRSILVRKYIAVWRERTTRRLLREEQAEAYYEERLLRRCKAAWFWAFCSRRVEGWHEQWIEKKGFARLVEGWQASRIRIQQAEHVYDNNVGRRVLRMLNIELQTRRHNRVVTGRRRENTVASKCLSALRTQARLRPLARNITQQRDEYVKQKALDLWRHEFTLSQQAGEVNRRRKLQNAWTKWNDSLRCKALAQKIDERVLMQSLYRWILQERLLLFQRTANGRLLGRAMAWWRGKVAEERDQLAEAEIVFRERQRRRQLASGMRRLNMATRSLEDAERAAVEFTNSRALPKALETWKSKCSRARQLVKYATDARFYFLCSGTLRIWNERTSEHKANRRRQAYIQVRARIKIRLVSGCLGRMRTKCAELHSMDDQAQRRAQTSLADVRARAFARWRERTTHYSQIDTQAQHSDQQKLLSHGLAALNLASARIISLKQQAHQFQRSTGLALEAGALKRLQWAAFTISRKAESADALWVRNRDQHVKHMLRHWAAQTMTRRIAATEIQNLSGIQEDEPESPSLRPASRAAGADITMPSSPPTQAILTLTPSYLRSPSRPRRAGRFRALPTPAPLTPMAFDPALVGTTSAHITTAPPEYVPDRVTPFARKLRAGGFAQTMSASALKSSVHAGTSKSVRFAGGGRFGRKSMEENANS